MMSDFQIMFDKNMEHRYDDYDLSSVDKDVPNIVYAELLLNEKFRVNSWFIQLGNKQYHFFVEAIWFIWEHLPSKLSSIADGQESTEFEFPDQGTEASIIVEPSDVEHQLFVSVIYQQVLKIQRLRVSKNRFISEWVNFANVLIELFLKENFIEPDDPSLIEYREQLPKIDE